MDHDRRDRIVQHCTHCGARILWAITINGKRMPINVATAEHGNVSLTRDSGGLYAHVLGAAEATRQRTAGRRLYLAHAATCTRPRQRPAHRPLRPASRIR